MATSARRFWIPVVIAGGTLLLFLVGALLFHHARSQTNSVALSSLPKGVTVVEARAATYRPTRRYVGTIEPWVQAKVGPQLVSAYVDTVLVRPGDVVKRGQVIATLDCRTASASSRALAMQARSLEATQAALAREASRVQGLLDGGFASTNEAEQKKAESESKQAQLLALQAQAAGTELQVSDCILRAPFEGEVAERLADPGAFLRPGMAIATIVDRSVMRLTADVPEDDFESVPRGAPLKLHLLATNRDLNTTITRRAPSADPGTRTIHIESDLRDPERSIPVGTTAEISLEVGESVTVTEVPLLAASVKGTKAAIFVLVDDVVHAKSVVVKGEREGRLFVDAALAPGSLVVTEGRSALVDGDRVQAKKEPPAAPHEGPQNANVATAGAPK